MSLQMSNKGASNPLYEKDEFREDLVDLRNDGKTWDIVSNTLQDKYNCSIGSSVASELYTKIQATTITVEKKAGADYSKFRDRIKDLWGESLEELEILMKALKVITKSFKTSEDEDQLIVAHKLMKMMPQIKGLISEIREYNKFQKDQEDKITAEQEKLYFSPQQINQQLEIVLKLFEKEGKIKILKDLGFE